jgi:thiosulfate/3-mercaptopyruvate sulfurtransferase
MGYRRPELLATPEWLVESIDRPGLQVLDLRWRPDGTGRSIYAAGHIPGATYLDWRSDLTATDDEADLPLLAGPAQVTAALNRAGLGNGMVAVLYDDAGSSYAARAWWTLRVYGLQAARILNGGLAAWRSLSQPVSAAHELRPPSTFIPRMEPRLRVSAEEVRELLGSNDTQLVDTRAPSEFAGHAGTTRRLGHLPGAINIAAAAATTEPGNGRFRDADELRTLFRRAGVDFRKRVVCYDTSGLGACKLAFALTLVGHDDVAVYDGGWAEWGDRLDLPLER